jgi:hypothetical protein
VVHWQEVESALQAVTTTVFVSFPLLTAVTHTLTDLVSHGSSLPSLNTNVFCPLGDSTPSGRLSVMTTSSAAQLPWLVTEILY